MKNKTQKEIFQILWSFWQHFWIHKRKSDFSWKNIISVFPQDCPYPVWHRDEWLKNSNPPSWFYNKNLDFWEQIWDLFKKCPISHNVWNLNDNCEYTDDCWNSKNCYLCHSLADWEDLSYCYRVISVKDSQFCVFSYDLQRCYDVIYWFDSYNIKYAIDIKRCKNSSFLFDCENLENCLLCWNLKNKKYCIANKQYTKEEYEKEIKKYDLSSRKVYNKLKKQFLDFIENKAYWKNIHYFNTNNCVWDYIDNSDNSQNCFFVWDTKDCKNWIRSWWVKSSKNFVSIYESEKIFNSTMVQDNCFNISYCWNVIRSKNLEYCINCFDCENCFLSAGLVWKKFFILNKEYKEVEYKKLKYMIISDMKDKWVYWDFFPNYFSATSYNESLSWFSYPLSIQEQKELWFNVFNLDDSKNIHYKNVLDIPDILDNTKKDDIIWAYYDEKNKKVIQITSLDIEFCTKMNCPLNDKFYIERIKDNFSWLFPHYELRETKCSKSWKIIKTTLPEKFDSRIISIEEYDKLFY